MTYEQVYHIIELYNKYKDTLNDDGTVATDEQIAEWIVPSVEGCKEEISEEELEKLANKCYPDKYEMGEYDRIYHNIYRGHERECFKKGCKEILKRF